MPVPGEVMVGNPRSRLLPLSLLGVVVVAVLLAFVGVRAGGEPQESSAAPAGPQATADEVAAAYLDAWEAEDWEALQALTEDPALDAGVVYAEAHRILRVAGTRTDPRPAVIDGDRATVTTSIAWDLGELGTATFDVEVPLVRDDEGWSVQWWYPVVHPDLTPERRFQRVRLFRERAPILGADGAPLVATVPQMAIGLDPGAVDDPQAVLAALADVGADPAVVDGVLGGDGGGSPLAVLDLDAFEAARERLTSLAGVTATPTSTRREAVPGLSALLGGVGEITAEALAELGAPYAVGDRVGLAGIERAQERRLAGEPQQEARIVEGSQLIETLAFVDGAAPEGVQVTLDAGLTQAGRAALGATAQPAALVAVDIATGQIRAAVSTPDGELQRALVGRYPPGSTFKIVTAQAALSAGFTPESVVDCPPVATFGGRDLRNAGGDGPGPLTVREAMARSCNTAFGALAQAAGPDALAAAVRTSGFDVGYEVGLPAFGGTFPATGDAAGLAAAAIGQGQVEASPLHMASVVAAAVSGTWRSPHLLADAEVVEQELPADVIPPLRDLLRAAVADGTGRAAELPGEPVLGKTGSAEFGTGPQLSTHAWFVAARGDLAVAVLVEGGGGGGAVAAPIAAAFLTAIADGQAAQ